MNTIINKKQDLVARVQIGEGSTHDMEVNEFMDDFIRYGEDYVKKQLMDMDDDCFCYFVRLEAKGDWDML